MANRAVSLVWRCKTPYGWRRFPVLFDSHKRIRKGWVMEHGEESHYPIGHFQIRSYSGSRLVWTPVETDDPVLAMIAARAHKKKLITEGGAHDDLKRLKNAAAAYVQDCKDRRAFEAAEQARNVLDEFVPLCAVSYVGGVTRQHVLDFHKVLRKRGCSDRTVANKHLRLKSFLKFAGVDVKAVMPPVPKYEAKLPTIYTPEEIAAILTATDEYLRIVIELGLKLGLREQEISHAEFGDVNEKDHTFRVQSKPRYKFRVKDSEQRDIPIPTDLLARLKEWKENHSKGRLIVPTATGEPNQKLLRSLKRLARRAGLNCGRCDGCKGELQECQQWTLHKFRRTFCTTLLRNGIDLKTCQSLMGHSDLASTMRYLRPASTKEMQSQINAIKWA